MGGGKHLLLLSDQEWQESCKCQEFPCCNTPDINWETCAEFDIRVCTAFVLLVRCQEPTVSMSPPLKQIFIGDLLYFKCDTKSNEDKVKWYLNDTLLNPTNKTLRIAAAAPDDSGSYSCEINSGKSKNVDITVFEYLPIATLIIETGQPVIEKGCSVILNIENDDGLKGWRCWVFRENRTNMILLRLQDNEVRFSFQPRELSVAETIFWCTDKDQRRRSNQITIRTSESRGALEMYPLPAVAGRSLTLRCLVWGADTVIRAVFYRENTVLTTVSGSDYNIDNMEKSMAGNYRCEASYRYKDQTVETQRWISDTQEVPFQVSPVQAVLLADGKCSCPSCPSDMTYRYYKRTGKLWMNQGSKPLWSDGTYYCRGISDHMKTLPSKSLDYQSSLMIVWIILIILVILAIGAIVLLVFLRKMNSARGQIYEDVALRLQGDDKYDTLHPREREAEYDTLNPGASGGQEKGGEYEALNKKEMKEGVYDTLEATGAEGGNGGYEALKKERMEGAEYETLETKSEVNIRPWTSQL